MPKPDPIDEEQNRELQRQREHDAKQDSRIDDLVGYLKIIGLLLAIVALFVAIDALFMHFKVVITLSPK